ncbi:hypothetical protein NDU88_006595 [Pleurodeles waltl]|uniref:Uncharacterized protein n=1 Tax=Pleurodeles waltl TaxID=8319 RepID=A0AAV7QP12_PLEWA|nr:hypothetical protein NDU88_006595 [Pleurodeles waltl]
MSGPCSHKKDAMIRDLRRRQGKKQINPRRSFNWCTQMQQAMSPDKAKPVARPFLETLFGALCVDIAKLKQDFTKDIKDLTKDINELGDRVDGLERTSETKGEELDAHHCEILDLHVKNAELRYQRRIAGDGVSRTARELWGTGSHPTTSWLLLCPINGGRRPLLSPIMDRAHHKKLRLATRLLSAAARPCTAWMPKMATTTSCWLRPRPDERAASMADQGAPARDPDETRTIPGSGLINIETGPSLKKPTGGESGEVVRAVRPPLGRQGESTTLWPALPVTVARR